MRQPINLVREMAETRVQLGLQVLAGTDTTVH